MLVLQTERMEQELFLAHASSFTAHWTEMLI